VCCQHVPPHLSAARYRSTYTDPGLCTHYYRVLESLLELGQDLCNVPVAMGPEPVLYSYAPGTTHCVVSVLGRCRLLCGSITPCCSICCIYCMVAPLPPAVRYVVRVHGLSSLLCGNTTASSAKCCVCKRSIWRVLRCRSRTTLIFCTQHTWCPLLWQFMLNRLNALSICV
jgi:hypothetical protein